jgi:hypothetical protein
MVNEKRGSEELYERLSRPVELNKEELFHLVRAAEATSARILDWTIYGKPGIDRLRASFEVSPERLPAFIEGVIGSKARLRWEAFPEGVPPFIDNFRVVLDNMGGPR